VPSPTGGLTGSLISESFTTTTSPVGSAAFARPMFGSGLTSLGSQRNFPPASTVGSPPGDVFGLIDKNGDGVITRDEWARAVSGTAVTPTAISKIPPLRTSLTPPRTSPPPRARSDFAFGVPRKTGGSITPPRFRADVKIDTGCASSRAGSQAPAVAKSQEWERQIKSLDEKEMELHQNQMRLLREQLASFTRELVCVKHMVGELQQHRERDSAQLGQIQEQVRREQQDTRQEVLSLLANLEQDLGNHKQDFLGRAERQAQFELHHATMGERVEFLEKACGDSADKHAKELEAMRESHSRHANHLQELQGLHSHHATMEGRLNFVEQLLGDSADNQQSKANRSFRPIAPGSSAPAAAILERLSNLEQDVGCTNEKHGKALEALGSSHDKHTIVMSKASRDLESLTSRHEAQVGDHATIAERVSYLEQQIGDSADQNVAAVADLHERLAAEQGHRERYHSNMSELHGQAQNEWAGNHATVNERITFIEERVKDDRKTIDSCFNRMMLLREAWSIDTPRDSPRGS